MNKKLGLAVAGAVMAFASSAQAGITIPAGDWTLDIGGNVNAYYTSTSQKGDTVLGGLGGGTTTVNNITTGLLPNFLGFSGKTRQNDLDIAFTISFNPGASSNNAASGGSASEHRQAFMTFGDASWGSVKVGKDLGIFASDAILNDMTLLGVGSGASGVGTTTLGRIGTGFMYADWKSQIAYTTPNWNGFQFTAGVTQSWNATAATITAADTNTSTGTDTAAVLASAGSTQRGGNQPAFEAKASYAWTGDVAGKVWASAFSQEVKNITAAAGNERAYAWDLGANVNVGNFGLTGYYYDGKGVGTTFMLANGFDTTGKRRDSNGGYVQATYVIPTGTKLGVSWGQSNLDRNSAETKTALIEKNEMWTVGAYHPLTKSLNVVAEYSDVKSEAQLANVDGKSKTVSLGAILFF